MDSEQKRSKGRIFKTGVSFYRRIDNKKDGVSFQQFIEGTYLPWYKTQVKESTYLNRATTIKKHFSYFYKMETDEIEPIHVQNWQLKLAKILVLITSVLYRECFPLHLTERSCLGLQRKLLSNDRKYQKQENQS